MTGRGPTPPRRVRLSYVEWVSQRMTERDYAILETVNRLRLVTSRQIERLYFSSNTTVGSRNAARGRALRRLVAWRVLALLPRRIGGMTHGSDVQVLALDSTGRRLLALRQAAEDEIIRVRAAVPPGERTVRHILAVAELYTQLTEQVRDSGVRLTRFETEPACWWPDGLGGYLKPDALAVLQNRTRRYYFWIEMDLATETLATIRRKLRTYQEFVLRGETGPHDVLPILLFSVPDERRAERIRNIIRALSDEAEQLRYVALHGQTAACMAEVLRE